MQKNYNNELKSFKDENKNYNNKLKSCKYLKKILRKKF